MLEETIPCALTAREAALLASLAQGRRVYEAGALLGGSSLTILRGGAKHLLSVDPHDGYPADKPRPTWDHFLFNTRSVADRLTPVRAVFQKHPIPPGTEVAFADLTGKHAVTERFLRMALAAGVPHIAVHDYARWNCGGATRAVDEAIRQHRLHAYRVDTLIVVSR